VALHPRHAAPVLGQLVELAHQLHHVFEHGQGFVRARRSAETERLDRGRPGLCPRRERLIGGSQGTLLTSDARLELLDDELQRLALALALPERGELLGGGGNQAGQTRAARLLLAERRAQRLGAASASRVKLLELMLEPRAVRPTVEPLLVAPAPGEHFVGAPQPDGKLCPQAAPLAEIGRASCRERGWIAVRAGAEENE